MNNLHPKIKEAAFFFQTHDFKKSLQIYDQCINICTRNQEPKSLLNNLMSSKGALLSILGDQKGALQCLNEVLKDDPYHFLCLMRRSQVLKKKNKLKKALKDLKTLSNFSPDNLQIAAMRMQIQNMLLKSKKGNSSSQSESSSSKSMESDDMDEQEKLNFSNLRMIDRKSVSMVRESQVSRKSRVTIAGDIAIVYETVQDDAKDDKSFTSTNVSKQYLKQKYVKTFREIQLDEQEDPEHQNTKINETPVIKVKSTVSRTKSILKNRESLVYVNNEHPIEKQKKYGGRESKIIDLLKNIDGKLIQTDKSRVSTSIKQVEFRKSIFGAIDQFKSLSLDSDQNLNGTTKPESVRKSCLKRPSFGVATEQVKNVKARRSKFDSISTKGIDGVVIPSERNSKGSNKLMVDAAASDSGSDEGSEHNIFGNHKIVISKEIRQNLGLGEDLADTKKEVKLRAGGGKSILKKHSVLVRTIEKAIEQPSTKEAKQAKKSVMFSNFQ